ncbi:MAG: DUF6599 family protein [Phycisphaerae bacterium]|jgi:hypothetical protein
MPEKIKQNRKQSIASSIVVAALVVIAVTIGFKQNHFVKLNTGDVNTAAKAGKVVFLTDSLFGEGFAPADSIENYNSDNLYEKIDGKADLYLNNGFVSLQTRRFAEKSSSDSWAEAYFYDMGKPENAFAVYSTQKRSDSESLNWTQFGYSVSDSVYVVFGRYYVEIFLSSENEKLLGSAESAAKRISSAVSAGKTDMPMMELFPKENLVADSFKFIPADAFGCSDLKNIFTSEYKIGDKTVTIFLSTNTPAETYDKYYRFLLDNGGEELTHGLTIKNCKAVSLFGSIELFFYTNNYFAGVRGEATIENLRPTAERLIKNISNDGQK